jgi:hypothetical protein
MPLPSQSAKEDGAAPVVRTSTAKPDALAAATVRSVSRRWSMAAPSGPSAGMSRVLARPGSGKRVKITRRTGLIAALLDQPRQRGE